MSTCLIGVKVESYVAVSECVNVAQVYVGCDTYIYIVCTDTEWMSNDGSTFFSFFFFNEQFDSGVK